ncbi:glycosyl transferase [Spirosoma sp. HMF4905]|uniref:Glycosyl transferase n=1 Tax=Spirosoma arboris TaxID=2682092 RepID=A0A7K1SD29_9BACT|nr:macrolide family glycosyltransferase [Spirosoma arboris]MVM31695.1 glycosyl transferase [Spirosoma arboris]
MAKVLFLSIPSHGHMNPMLGLAAELVNQGEHVTFFSSDEFKKSIEDIGAHYLAYQSDMNIFQKKPGDTKPQKGLMGSLMEPKKFIDDVLAQIRDVKFDYIVFSAAYPYATTIKQILNLPSVSSFAVFVTMKELMESRNPSNDAHEKKPFGVDQSLIDSFKPVREKVMQQYGVTIPENIFDLLINKGDLNIIYTSEYFIRSKAYYDDSFIFVGPPVYDKKYNVDFPFDKLAGKKVIYISMGTIFGNHSQTLNQLFFEAFRDTDYVVVMAAHNVDLSTYTVPSNFIIRDYVPQLELLKHTSIAITHAGMNSIGDLLYNEVPFVAIPLGADQFYMANRAAELGATLVLDINTITAEAIKEAVDQVLTHSLYRENIHKISASFKEAGGYKKAVAAIFELMRQKGVLS